MTRSTIFIGTDSGATTSKVGGVFADGATISTKLNQRPTHAAAGPDAVVAGWVGAIDDFLAAHQLAWGDVAGVGLAIPGPYQRYGVLEAPANLPASFAGWNVHEAYQSALTARAGRPVPLTVGNDGAFGGVAEAQRVRGQQHGSVLMLSPGSGLGTSFVGASGLPMEGDTLAAMETAHMALPLHLLGAKPFRCGCGRTWGCAELYTTLAGLPQLLAERLADRPDHPLSSSPLAPREKAFSLRGLAQDGDVLALELFDFQARALGFHIANLVLALDPQFVVIGGGLMDPENTAPAFRERYLALLRETALAPLWPVQRERLSITPSVLGDLSQAIGAALVALYRHAEAVPAGAAVAREVDVGRR
jgi:glucokinase